MDNVHKRGVVRRDIGILRGERRLRAIALNGWRRMAVGGLHRLAGRTGADYRAQRQEKQRGERKSGRSQEPPVFPLE